MGAIRWGAFHSAHVLRCSNDHLLPKYITALLGGDALLLLWKLKVKQLWGRCHYAL